MLQISGLLRLTLALGKGIPPNFDSEGSRIDHIDGLGHFPFGLGANRYLSI